MPRGGGGAGETGGYADWAVRMGSPPGGPCDPADGRRAGPDAPVPACPGWRIRDLVRHVGNVHAGTGYVGSE